MTVRRAIQLLLERRENGHVEISAGSDLREDLGLDSLELAEFSAVLEEELGCDPYTEGIVPRTVAEVVSFYDR